ncbi:hypothetical protein [Agromyces kandeliae]|uniref:Uncharacterized protein n=1 Tax=Agromyces kandeliae TaxID=2666141 RepID=A0A6L5R3I3_9MICO|nr:hypothetical protein [Agromyces kandeliae]MRX44611.1 hypothetical protein [Agromyces kandeliae]
MRTYSSTQDERRAVADCLTALVSASKTVQRAMRGTSPRGVIALDPTREINAAVRLIALHQSVATDHLASFAGLLTLPGSHGPSLATLDRSLLETWARAWWVMDAPTSTRAEYRARAMVVAELEAGAARGIQMLSTEPIGVAIQRAMRERDEIRVVVREKVPRPTALAKQMLQQIGSPAGEAAAIYSHLSGVAHGESVFTESLSERPGGPDFPEIALPSDNLAKYCTTVFGVTVIGTSQLIRVWQLPAAVGDAFAQATADVASMLRTAESG